MPEDSLAEDRGPVITVRCWSPHTFQADAVWPSASPEDDWTCMNVALLALVDLSSGLSRSLVWLWKWTGWDWAEPAAEFLYSISRHNQQSAHGMEWGRELCSVQ